MSLALTDAENVCVAETDTVGVGVTVADLVTDPLVVIVTVAVIVAVTVAGEVLE